MNHICIYIYIHIYICIAAAQRHWVCNRPGRPFCDKTCSRLGVRLVTNPRREKLIEDCSALHRGLREKVCSEGEGGTATNGSSHIQVFIYEAAYLPLRIGLRL